MSEPIFTDHAAKQILARNIDPRDVMAVAKNAIRLGLTGRVEGRGIKLVMDGHVIITAYKVAHNPDAARRSNRRQLAYLFDAQKRTT